MTGPTTAAAAVVGQLFDSMQARDWAGARACVAPDALIVYPVSGERFRGDAWLAMNEAYPEGWSIKIADILGDGVGDVARVAARVQVTHGDEVFWCAGFYTVESGRIVDGTELWSTERSEPAPDWRAPYWS